MELKKIYQKKKETNNMLFYTPTLAQYGFMHDYIGVAGIKNIDNVLIRKYGNRIFDDFGATESEQVAEWNSCIEGIICAKHENLQRIWDALLQEYDPLYNYDKISDITTTRQGDTSIQSGTDTTTHAKTGTNESELTKSGSEENEHIIEGSEKRSDTIGASHAESQASVNTWDASENNTGKNVTSTNAQENVSELEYTNRVDTDTTTYDQRKDSRVDTYNTTDTDTRTVNLKDSINTEDYMHEETKGNIGIKTSTEMLASEVDVRWKLDFYMNLFRECIFELTW